MPEDKGLTRSAREEKVLRFWKENKIFEKTLEKDSPEGEFVFYEGPPTANGKPGIHHLEARAFKDALPRYKTMRGYHVRRKAGWDTHGLPVELQIEKKLGFKSKKDIEEYGIEAFNKLCKDSVFEYINDWEKFTERIGYWVNFNDAYYTFQNPYIEAVWSVISHVNERDLLYKDYKVVPWCPRCGTALSSHELAQGYKDVKDLSLYVKFKVKNEKDTYILAWTTTPWTLPGNIALAVGDDIDYLKVLVGNETYILAEARQGILKENYEILEKIKGRDLVGLEYESLYPYVRELATGAEKEKLGKAFKVYSADFVTTEDGTGIVHTAVMYGQDDFDLGTKAGLPKVHLVSPDATFIKGTGWLEGRSVVDETLAVDILKDLQKKGLLLAKENHEHSYPFCWRCGTRLVYYARDSWYICMSELRNELVKENEGINWEPEYIKEGRFGEWLREVKDWAISRERYWGTPLPVWLNADGSKKIVIDSLETLKRYTKRSGNEYFLMRHGGTTCNSEDIVSFKNQAGDHLTEQGRTQAQAAAKKLKADGIDLIIASPFTRTKETAEIVAKELGIEVTFDKRLEEINPGSFDGKDWYEYHDAQGRLKDWFHQSAGGGESFADVLKRMGEALYEYESKYKNKKILIVTHGGPAWVSYVAAGIHTPMDGYRLPDKKSDTEIFVDGFKRFQNAEVRKLDFAPVPHNSDYEVDLHRPYIDEIILEKDGEEYERTKEVMDVWLDSGSMPFAQSASWRSSHGEQATDFSNILYPADFISEAIDQTRGWFYTMHAVGTLMGRGKAFKNAICLGHILDKEGKKMSKSLGNIIDPWEMIEKYGADTLRLWMYSVNQPGESKNFDEKTVLELERRIFNLLDNVYSFFELYADPNSFASYRDEHTTPPSPSPTLGEGERGRGLHVLDAWILTRLNELTNLVTSGLDDYKLLEPTRAIRDFIDDLSTWYLRRSRDRIKEGDVAAKGTLYFVLKTVSKILAPFAPFAAEDLYQKLRIEGDPESVHLESWPSAESDLFALYPQAGSDATHKPDSALGLMQKIRELVSLALEARSKSNIKIRQPLSELRIKNYGLGEEYLTLIRDEINVKKVVQDKSLETEVQLDTTITPELEEEGKVRELIRNIQEMRKEKGLKPKDVMKYSIPAEADEIFNAHKDEIVSATNIEVE